MNYDLPTTVEVGGEQREIRWEYREILDIMAVLSEPGIEDGEKIETALKIFYPGYDSIRYKDMEEAIRKCFLFLNGGEEEQNAPKMPRLLDWEQDLPIIISPVNRVIGREIRGPEPTHWYTFLSAFNEIGGDCTFAQVVSIRDKQARHKTLDKQDKEWLRRNRHLVEFKRRYTDAENELLKQWT